MTHEHSADRGKQASGTRGVALVAISAGIGSLGLAAGGTAGALAGAQLARTPAAAGIPLGVLVAGSAVAAIVIARHSRQRGRASGLSLGYAIGAVGALVVIIGVTAADFAVLLLGSFLLGAGNPAIFLTRYAGASAVPEDQRARGLGVVFFATAVGAVIGPNLLGPSARLATFLALPPLTGLYIVAIPAFGLAAVLLQLSRGILIGSRAERRQDRGLRQIARMLPSSAHVGLAVLAASNLVMVGVMAVAPVHLHVHGQELNVIGLIVGAHVLAMFAPAPLTGMLVDRTSPRPVIAAGAALLIASALSLTMLEPSRPQTMAVALTVLGLGWNACVVGGSALLTEATSDDDRPAVEGLGEIAMGMAAAVGTPAAGLGAGIGGLPVVAIAGGSVAVLLVAGTLRGRDLGRPPAVAEPRPARSSHRFTQPLGTKEQ